MTSNAHEPLLIKGQQIHEVWDELIRTLLATDYHVSPRSLGCVERQNVTIHVADAHYNVLVNTGRDLNYRFMVAEWLWIALGREDLTSIAYYNKELRKFSDNGLTLSGAYGPRISWQARWLTEKLKEDTETRQAVVTIFTPAPPASRDIPCTLSLQFFYRDKRLHLTVNMRSSDVWLGLPYDFFTFSMLLNGICSELSYEPGSVTMNLGSSHLYDANRDRAKEVKNWKSYTLRSADLPSWPPERMNWILDQKPDVKPNLFRSPWDLYVKTLQQPSRVASLGVMKELDAATIP